MFSKVIIIIVQYSAVKSYSKYFKCLQAYSVDKPIEVPTPAEEVKVKPALVLPHSREDYYGSLSDTCTDSHSSNSHMDSLKVIAV